MSGVADQRGTDGCLRELSLFSGSGGGLLGSILLGWRTVCAVEIDPYSASVLVARQNEGILPPFPIWDDIRTFDGKPWQGSVDVVSGGFPCQDVSLAGGGEGLDGEHSGLWHEMARVIREVRPSFVFVENSPVIAVRGFGRILGDLASMGFDARWGVLGANCAGYDHRRHRMWVVAYPSGIGLEGWHGHIKIGQRKIKDGSMASLHKSSLRDDIPPPDAFGVADGLAGRMDRTEAIGNGQVPAVVALAWTILSGGLE